MGPIHAAFFIAARLPNLVAVGGFLVIRAALRGKRSVGAATMIPASVSSPLALRPREAAKALGISPRLLWQLTRDGHVPCVRVGSGKRKSVLYPVADLQAWLTRQAAQAKGGEQ